MGRPSERQHASACSILGPAPLTRRRHAAKKFAARPLLTCLSDGRLQRSPPMDLGIAGRKAIVCASSRGLGRACAERLAEAGCEVVLNGLNRERLETVAAEIRQKTGAKITAVAGDVASPDGQKALFAACPE